MARRRATVPLQEVEQVSLRVSAILDRKGPDVVTIAPDAMLLSATDKLAEHGIGALVVSSDGKTVEGILSERDVVRQLSRYRTAVSKRTVAEVMSTEVTTCGPDATIDDLMAVMTERRIRHIPIVDDEGLVGIISIGDIVKDRLHELELTNESLEQYVTGRG